MLRKLVSAIVVLTLATIGSSQVSPAQAAGTFSTKASLPSFASYSPTMIPISDTETLLIGLESGSGASQLKSGILHSDGTFDSETELATLGNNAYFQNTEPGNWLITKDGVISFAWFYSERDSQNDLVTSYSYISFSENGKDWSSPNQLFAPKVFSEMSCFMMYECGYQSLQISQDIHGTLTAVTEAKAGQKTSIEASSSKDGVIWSAPTLLENSNQTYLSTYKLSAMPSGGFMVAWSIYVGGNDYVDRYSTMPPKLGFWNKAKDFGTATWSSYQPVIAQTDPNTVSLFFLLNDGGGLTVNQRKFNLATKAWSDAEAILSMPAGWLSGGIQFSMGKNWHGAIAVGGAINGVLEAHAYLVELNSSVPSAQKVFADSTEQFLSVNALRVNFDDSITIVTAGIDRPSRIFNFKAGIEQSVQPIPWTETAQVYRQTAVITPSGNIAMASHAQNDVREGLFAMAATLPIASGNPRVSGIAKSGKQVLASIPTFSSVSDIGLTKIQWYACAAKVLTVQTAVPAGCVAISKATSTKFKVTSKQKNKYLAVAVSNTNAVGVTTVFSPTTAKTK